ncbi:hypothetical protein ABBQ32_003954 [Trebouxia sp. C0010 RCD-2024]
MSSGEPAAPSHPSSLPCGPTDSASTLPGAKSWESIGASVLFEKVLTSSDINPQGRIVVPKAHAEKHLPSLEKQTPSEVHAQDTFGNQIVFKYRFWSNNQSRMYLLEGTQKIRAAYSLGPGDVIQFGKNSAGDLIVAGRKGTKADIHRKPPPPRGSSPAVTSTERTMTAAKRKRMQSSGHGKSMLTTDLNTFYFEPLKDGVFRAVPDALSDDAARMVKYMGVWTVILNLSGELYQAYFDCQAAAVEAFNAAGEVLPNKEDGKLCDVLIESK